MRKVIHDLLKEDFSNRPERLNISEEKIEGEILAGRRFGGRFFIGSAAGQVRGFLYSTNPRVTCTPEYFVGFRAEIEFEIRTEGLQAGDAIQGAFVICAPSGEYTLPYCLQITGTDRGNETQLPPMTAEAFAELAREDFIRAYRLFASRQFSALAQTWGPSAAALYGGLVAHGFSYHALDQFLTGLGVKQPLEIALEREHIFLGNVEEDRRESVTLVKSGWGFSKIAVSCDAPFLKIERPEATTEEFVGSSYELGFVIRKDKLHAGRNFARIRITAGCTELCCTLEACMRPDAASDGRRRMLRQEVLRLMNTYIGYRAGRTGLREWSGISLTCLDNIKKTGEESIFFDLYRTYILFCTGSTVDAQVMLSGLGERGKSFTDPGWKGCYLYLTTFENSSREYLEYVQEQIGGLYLASQENWLLQWLMLRVNGDSYRNDSEKLDAIRRQYICGCKSPVMYLEAWEILKKEPLQLRSLEEFEIHLLAFLAKEQLLDREICGQAAQLAARFSAGHPLLTDVLIRCYDQFPSKNLLSAICALLMKGHRTEERYAKWFDLGVRQDVRLAGLYEYYAQTAKDLNARQLPQTVQMYFSYNNTLGIDKKAALYANIVRARTRDPQTFETYRPAMERFLEEQLQAGRMNDDLALLCDALLTRYLLDGRLTEGLSRGLFTYEITCGTAQFGHVVAIHGELEQEQRVPFVNGKAYVQIYTPDCRILLEDKNAVRYADPALYRARRLLTRTDFEDFCRGQSPVPEGIVLHDLHAAKQVTGETAGMFVQLLGLPRLRRDFRRQTERQLLAWFGQNPRAEELPVFLLQADLEQLTACAMEELTELLVGEGLMEQAMKLVLENGPERVSVRALVRLCSYYVTEKEQEKDEVLLGMCARCFALGTYDEAVLQYLMKWYEGPIRTMKALWKAGSEFSLEEYALEEKILAMLLYIKCEMEQTEPIFASYVKKQGNERICRAYVIWMSYCYFVKEMDVGQPVFTYIEQRLMGEPNAPQVCQLALLRSYCTADSLRAGQQKWLLHLMDRFTSRGMYFRFYQRLPAKVLRRFELHDKYILEYRADPKSYVALQYSLNGEKEKTVPMDPVYEGIFVKTFTLFYQDKLEWHVRAEKNGGVVNTAAQTIVCGRRSHRGSVGRYELINRLAEAVNRQDKTQIEEIRAQYIGQQNLVEELFRIQ